MEYIIFYLATILIVYAVYRYLTQARKKTGQITLKNGNVYNYELGDNLKSNTLTIFSGIQLDLKKKLPPFYLDALHDKTIGPEQTFSNSEQIKLEGDFNEYYQLFSPEGMQNHVLSILSPDVMQTILQANGTYDIEIDGTKLNIIAAKDFYLEANQSSALIKVAKSILKELDHKARSITSSDEKVANSTKLKQTQGQSIRLMGKYYSLGNVIIFSLSLLGIFMEIAAAVAYLKGNQKSAESLFAGGFLLFPGIQWLIWSHNKRSKS